jgi:hypothetical protein
MSWKMHVLVVAALMLPARAFGAGDGYSPGPVSGEQNTWVKWACLALFIVGVAVAAFRNPKRTHLD